MKLKNNTQIMYQMVKMKKTIINTIFLQYRKREVLKLTNIYSYKRRLLMMISVKINKDVGLEKRPQ